jgi:hypothetical protein
MVAVASAPASALPPQLESVGASNGLVTASWSNPASVAPTHFEVAKYLEVNAYGYFACHRDPRPTLCDEGESNIVRFGVLSSGQTSLTADDPSPPLPAGTYYVHVAGRDTVHTGCPRVEFSDIRELTIAPDGSGTSRLVAPGTGNCTLIRGSGATGGGGGGSGGGGGGGSGVAGDKTPPVGQLRYRKRQDIDKLFVRARMSEPGTLTARAIVDVGGLLATIYTFRPATRRVTGGVLAKLPLKLSKRKKRAVKRALRRRKRVRARITVTAKDRAGNLQTLHATIRLKR